MKMWILSASLVTLALASAGCKEAASTLIEQGVAAAKDTTKGIQEGVDKGRVSGESLDGANVVATATELAGKGAVSVFSVHGSDGSADTEITLAFENTTDKPLRVTKLEFVALDKDGFAKKPADAASELTVPPKAKDKLSFSVPEKADNLAKVRVWDKDLDIEPSARK